MSTESRVACQVNFTSNEIGIQLITSKQVSDLFNKRHDNVLRQIDVLQRDNRFGSSHCEESDYLDSRGKTQPMFLLTDVGFAILVASFALDTEEDKEIQKGIFKRFHDKYIEVLNQNKLLREKLQLKLNKVGDTAKYICEPVDEADLFGGTITTHHKRVERNSKERLELLDLELYWLYKQKEGVDKSIEKKIKEIEEEKERLLSLSSIGID